MPKNDPPAQKPDQGPEEAPAEVTLPAPPPEPETARAVTGDALLSALTELAAGEPLCPNCASVLRVERRTPDFGTHYTQVCDNCGYRHKQAG